VTARKRRRWLARVGAAVAVLLTLVAGQAIIRTEPDRNVTVAPFYVTGEPNQPVTVGGLRVTMLGARGSAKVKPAGGLDTDTGGIWMIVRVRLEATSKTTATQYVALADATGRTFRASQRFKQPLGERNRDLQPGIPVEGEVAFEVPRDAATNLSLRIGETFNNITNGELSPFTDIRVPVTDSDVSRWLNDVKPAILANPTVVI
jgi:hypothetical protein